MMMFHVKHIIFQFYIALSFDICYNIYIYYIDAICLFIFHIRHFLLFPVDFLFLLIFSGLFFAITDSFDVFTYYFIFTKEVLWVK